MPPVRPIVYHPYAEIDQPSYERYADPAAAHGWENAYDETTELPRVPLAGSPAEGPEGGRADRRRAARRAGGWRERRVLTAAGAVGTVALAAVVAGLSFAGDPGGDQQRRQGGTRSASDGAVSSPAGPADSASGPAEPARPTPSASAGATPSPGVTPSRTPSAGSSAGAGTGAGTGVGQVVGDEPSAATSEPGRSNAGKGRGLRKGGR